jgi:hypothetical protein
MTEIFAKFRSLALLCLLLLPLAAISADDDEQWIGTWGASPLAFRSFGPAAAPVPFSNQTLRQKLRISVGGERFRVRFSNELGAAPLVIGAATIALAGDGSSIDRDSLRTLTFGGETSMTIPAGAPALSDPVDLEVGDLAELAISIFLPEESAPATLHMGRTAYVSGAGDFSRAPALRDAELTTNHAFLTGVYVSTTDAVPVVVALGDSITDGTA